MKQLFTLICILAAVFTLTACSNINAKPTENTAQAAIADHTHEAANTADQIDDPAEGFCGNIQVTVRRDADGEEYTFEGEDAIALTELLINAVYDSDICKCAPEYTVRTEFSEIEYGVSVSEGYIRCGDRQRQLTESELAQVSKTMSKLVIINDQSN